MEKVAAWETDIAAQSGAGIDHIREIRNGLPKGMVVTVKGRVGYTEAGLKEMTRLLLLGDAKAPPERKKRRGVVTRLFGNINLMEARVDDELVVVRVRDNSMFVPEVRTPEGKIQREGQQVPLLEPVEGSRVWWLGCRAPEVKGRLRGVNWGDFQ